MKYYKDENGNDVAQDLIEIQYSCRNCKTEFWGEVKPIEDIRCPKSTKVNSSYIVDGFLKTWRMIKKYKGCAKNNPINIFTVRENGGVKLPYRFKYSPCDTIPEKKKGFIPLSFTMFLDKEVERK